MNDRSRTIGHRVLVIGMAGSGKSTFSLALSAETGVPVIHLDLRYWTVGEKQHWVRIVADEVTGRRLWTPGDEPAGRPSPADPG